MRNAGLISFVCILFCITANAQSVENSINLYGLNFPREKVHVHFDKESYLPGEDVWFKAYIFEDHLPSERSTNFYIGLYDEDGKLLQQNMQPIIRSSADGNFSLPAGIKGKQVICRAYTSWMLNFDTSFLYTKVIRIINNNPAGQTDAGKPELQFFPEGGDVIEGEKNTIAFKASYKNGLPFNIQALVKRQETGEVVVQISAEHDGMGKFDLQQVPGEYYYAEWTDDKGQPQRTYLPAARTSGVSLKLAQLNGRLFYNIVNKLAGDSLYVLAWMYQKVIYKARIGLAKNDRTNGFIPVEGFPSGTLQFTVFDKNWQPVAERICFINNNNYSSNVTLTNKTKSTAPRAKNEIVVTVPDTLLTNMSLSVTDADLNSDPSAGIINSMLLNADIRGYINNPSYYFEANDAANRQALDLLLLTHGWRKYNWIDMRAGTMPEVKFPPDDYLSINGWLNKNGGGNFDKEQVNLIVRTRDSSKTMHSVFPDSTGLIKATGLLFYDTATIYFSLNNKNKGSNAGMAFSTQNNTLKMHPHINNYGQNLWRGETPVATVPNTSLFAYYLKAPTLGLAGEKTLETVKVKANLGNWRNDPLVKLDERYATGMFSGGATNFVLDVMSDYRAQFSFNIYDYLNGKIPGLAYKRIGEGKEFIFQQGPVVIYIDESYHENTVLQGISVNQIAYIKLLPRSLTEGPKIASEAGGRGFTAVLAIYMRKGDDLRDPNAIVAQLSRISVMGYTPVKEFYAPDYGQMINQPANDARSTLLWQPYLVTDKSVQSIPITFYNNDFTKRIRIVLEGINEAGKLVHVEKVID